MKITLLHSFGRRDIDEYEWTLQPLPKNAVRVKTRMTGVCRSDIGAYAGWEKPMPIGSFGHEGLGEVVEIGEDLLKYKGSAPRIGDIVATYSDPAYGDYYFAKEGEFVIVPEASPKYILQPVACAYNIWEETTRMMRHKGLYYKEKVLILGTGFLSMIIAAMPKEWQVEVVGKSNKEWFERHGVKQWQAIPLEGKYSTIIDLSSRPENFDRAVKAIKQEGVLCYAATPTEAVTTNFFDACWKALTIILPSPRSDSFSYAMERSRDLVETGHLDPTPLWTRVYDRHNFEEVCKAFEDGVNRPQGYIRGYIKW